MNKDSLFSAECKLLLKNVTQIRHMWNIVAVFSCVFVFDQDSLLYSLSRICLLFLCRSSQNLPDFSRTFSEPSCRTWRHLTLPPAMMQYLAFHALRAWNVIWKFSYEWWDLFWRTFIFLLDCTGQLKNRSMIRTVLTQHLTGLSFELCNWQLCSAPVNCLSLQLVFRKIRSLCSYLTKYRQVLKYALGLCRQEDDIHRWCLMVPICVRQSMRNCEVVAWVNEHTQ